MKPERWHRIERLFDKALEMEKSRRTAFLREACAGDRDLQQEMERLLAEKPASFLEEPALREIAQEFAATASAAWVGRKVGNYEFMSLVGAGGMGEVYRAHDTQLKREVAIKILPEEFSGDPERIIRLQREAQLLASLNHPNIAAIYDLEETNGFRFLILELVEGETLEERLNRGPIPLDHALPIAAQITEGLAAAHERGIIHRDLKPANIKLTFEGKVKLLDFGLAKSSSGEAADMNPSKSQAKLPASTPGMILGTAAYMSPEQANGAVLDRRTDIFTFGAVLYEMLTGLRAFPGETAGDIVASVIRAEPDWSKLPADTPSGIRRLLRRCLQKDRNRRLQTAGDARIEIDEAPSEPQLDVHVVPSAPRRRERLAWSALAVVTLIAAVAVVSALRPVPPLHEMRLEIITPPTTDPESLAISPDGQKVVFVVTPDGRPRLWLRSLDSVDSAARPLTGTDNASFPFWSPDNRSIGFFADGKLKRIDLDNGSVQMLADATVGRGGTWSPSGVILFSPASAAQLVQVQASGGQALTQPGLPGKYGLAFPQFLPDGRQFLFYAYGSESTRGIHLGSLDSRETKRLTAADTAGAYMAPGWLLFLRQGALVARRFDLLRGELIGDAVTVADPVGFDSRLSVGAFSVSAAGVVAYRPGNSARQLTWFDRSGKAFGTMGAPDRNDLVAPALSPDGNRAMVHRSVQGNTDLWLFDGARTTRFTLHPDSDSWAVWAPDGIRIAFGSNRKGVRDLYQTGGPDGEVLLLESSLYKTANSWSPDGRFLLYTNLDSRGADLWVLPLEGDRTPFPFLNTPFDERVGQFSPNGRWVAYQSNESGQNQIYVNSFPEAGRQSQVSTSGGIQARWRRDGKELYYIAPDGKLMAVPIVVRSTTIEPGIPVALFQTRIWGLGTNAFSRQQYDVAPDGRFLINVTTEDATNTPITLLLNWKPPAK